MNIFNYRKKSKQKERSDSFKQVMSEFNRSLSLFVDKEQLRANIISKLKKIISVEDIYIFLLNAEQNKFVAEKDTLPIGNFSFLTNCKLAFWLNINETYLNLKDNKEVFDFLTPPEQEILSSLKIEIVYPMRVMNQTKGFVLLPGKRDKTSYNQDEIELLSNLLDQASFALENASLIRQQKERLKKMYRADRLAMMGQLAAGAAHEIRNPLTSIRSTIQYLKKDIEDSDKKELANGLIEEVDRINDIIQGLLSFAKPSSLQLENVDLNTLLDQSVRFITNTASKKQVKVNCKFAAEEVKIYADPGQLKQVFLNILMNAIQAIDNGGEINIDVDSRASSNLLSVGNAEQTITFRDNGKGIPRESLEKIFDPFFTTKQDGTGLGLSISYSIINCHGGDINIESTPGSGTSVIIKLPITN